MIKERVAAANRDGLIDVLCITVCGLIRGRGLVVCVRTICVVLCVVYRRYKSVNKKSSIIGGDKNEFYTEFT